MSNEQMRFLKIKSNLLVFNFKNKEEILLSRIFKSIASIDAPLEKEKALSFWIGKLKEKSIGIDELNNEFHEDESKILDLLKNEENLKPYSSNSNIEEVSTEEELISTKLDMINDSINDLMEKQQQIIHKYAPKKGNKSEWVDMVFNNYHSGDSVKKDSKTILDFSREMQEIDLIVDRLYKDFIRTKRRYYLAMRLRNRINKDRTTDFNLIDKIKETFNLLSHEEQSNEGAIKEINGWAECIIYGANDEWDGWVKLKELIKNEEQSTSFNFN